MKFIALILFIFAVQADGCDAKEIRLLSCKDFSSNARVAIKFYEGSVASVCPTHDSESCFEYQSSQDVYKTLDFNNDGAIDYILKANDLYGIEDDVNTFTGYLSCKDGTFVVVLASVLSDVLSTEERDDFGFLKLNASRRCLSTDRRSMVDRTYTMIFESKTRTYGPPDGDYRLAPPCSTYEKSTPGREI